MITHAIFYHGQEQGCQKARQGSRTFPLLVPLARIASANVDNLASARLLHNSISLTLFPSTPSLRYAFANEQTIEPVVQTITKPIGGDKNGGERTIIVKKGPKWYPADDIKRPVPGRKHLHKKTKVRPSIKPGSVLVLLTGHTRGSRVVYLKQLTSGMLLVTGPYSVNNIPLRRVNQSYVIATSTTIDVSGVDVSKIDDPYFKRVKGSGESVVMETDEGAGEKKSALTEEKIANQKAVDAVLVPIIEKEAFLSSYLKSKFTLSKGQYPHEMKF